MDFTDFDVMTVVVLVTVCSVADIACGTTATEFAISATVSLFTVCVSTNGTMSFVALAALRLVRVARCVTTGAGDSSVIVLGFAREGNRTKEF